MEGMSCPLVKRLTRPHTSPTPVYFHALPRECDSLPSVLDQNKQLLEEAQRNAAFPEVEIEVELETRRLFKVKANDIHHLEQDLPSAEALSVFLQLELSCRGGPDGQSELPTLDTFVRDGRLTNKLNLDHEASIDFEDTFWLVFKSGADTPIARPYPETLRGTPIQNVIDLDILGELALQYPDDWKPGTLLNGSRYAGRYSKFMRTVLDNEVLDVQ
jgi:hypothetical protein